MFNYFCELFNYFFKIKCVLVCILGLYSITNGVSFSVHLNQFKVKSVEKHFFFQAKAYSNAQVHVFDIETILDDQLYLQSEIETSSFNIV